MSNILSIQADTHTHTCASVHAYSTITENAHHAASIGLKAIAMTDHAPQMPDGCHLWHFLNMRVLPRELEGVTILRGAEVDILDKNGTLDLDDEVLASLDWVVASMHNPICTVKTVEESTNAYLRIAEHPYVDVIGHSGTACFAYDYRKVIPVFGELGKLVEINASSLRVRPDSKNNCVEIAKLCKQYCVPIVVNSDAHFSHSVGAVAPALKMLEELEFPQELILNASAERLFDYVASKRGSNWRDK